MANKVEIALKLLKDQFVQDSKTAASAYTKDINQIRKAGDQLVAAQKKGKSETDKLNAARSNLGVTSLRQQQREVSKLTASYNRLANSGKAGSRELLQAQEALRRKVAEVRGEVIREGNALKSVGKSLAPFIGVGAATLFAKRLGGSAIAASDDYKRLNSQIRLVTNSQEELASTNEKLFRLAQETRSEFAPVVTLYTRAARATKSLGLSQNTLLDITRAVNQATQISGATQQESTSSVIQFTQALQSGVLRGEEFNSVSENGARLITALADGLGVPIEKMRELAEAGELTRDKLIAALTSQSSVINAEFEQLDLTVEQSLTRLSNSFQRAVAQSDTSGLIDAIKDLERVVSDPATIEGLANLTGAIVSLVNVAINAGTEFAQFSKNLGEDIAALIHGPLGEIGELDKRIERLKESLGDTFTLGFGVDLGAGFVDDAEVLAKISELEKLRDLALERQGFQTEPQKKAAAEAVQIEQTKSDQITGIERQIAETKNSLSELHLERSKKVADAELKIAKAKGAEVIQQIKQDLNAQKTAINDRLNLIREAGQKILDVERKIADERRNIADIEKGVEDKLFERSLTGKSDDTQQKEIEQRATERLIDAEQALRDGRLEEALQNSQQVQVLSDRLTNIDRANALLVEGSNIEKKVSEENIKFRESQGKALKEYQEIQQSIVALQREELETQQTSLSQLTEQLQSLGQVSPTIKIESNIDQVLAQLGKLEAKLANLQNSGFSVGGSIPGFNTGGAIDRRMILAEDGEWYLPPSVVNHYGSNSISAINKMQLPKFAEGGKLPGYGGGDRRLMAPQVGGYIIRKEAARKYGDGLMSSLLAKRLPKFQLGGGIGQGIRINPGLMNLPQMAVGGSVPAAANSSPGTTQRHEIVLGEKQFNIFGEDDQVRGLVTALTEVARGG